MNSSTTTRRPSVLSSDEIEQFIDRGYVLLREAFSSDAAGAVRAKLWPEFGLDPNDPTGWTKPSIRIELHLLGPEVDACLTDRFRGAVDDLLGAAAWEPLTGLGGWPALFPGFSSGPWAAPKVGWHIDGIHFHHRLDTRTQGLLPIFLFSDIGPGDGGTAIRPGSHKVTARILLAAEPEGLSCNELAQRTNEFTYAEEIEAVGNAGDVLLLHPFMSHATSVNTGSRVRFICNPCVSLKEPMNLNRPDPANYTPLERSIVEAIGR